MIQPPQQRPKNSPDPFPNARFWLYSEALCRTRTGDPFLTMEVLYQLS